MEAANPEIGEGQYRPAVTYPSPHRLAPHHRTRPSVPRPQVSSTEALSWTKVALI